MKYIITSVIFTLLLFFSLGVNAQWEIPDADKNKKAPNETSIELALKGKKIYKQACISCHGTPTQADGILPTATDLGSDKYFERLEGEAYYQIAIGMGAMPGFKDKYSEEEIWSVVHYVKTFNPESTVDLSAFKSVEFDINVKLNNNDKSIVTTISTADTSVSIEGIKMEFFVKRYFGDLPITDAPMVTDANGSIKVVFPNDIPGDEQGNLDVLVRFENQDMHGNKEFKKTINWGTHTEYRDIMSERAMWSVGTKTPIWLLALYLGITGGVWLVIFYVLSQIMKIKKAGKK